MSKATPDQKYPSLDLAYEYIPSSYEWMLRRISAVEERIQSQLAQSTIALIGIPAIVGAINGGKISWTLWAAIPGILALAAFFAIRIGAVRTLKIGKLATIDPGLLIVDREGFDPQSDVELDPTEFKRHLIETAGEHMRDNSEFLDKMAGRADWMGHLLIVEMVTGATWGVISLTL